MLHTGRCLIRTEYSIQYYVYYPVYYTGRELLQITLFPLSATILINNIFCLSTSWSSCTIPILIVANSCEALVSASTKRHSSLPFLFFTTSVRHRSYGISRSRSGEALRTSLDPVIMGSHLCRPVGPVQCVGHRQCLATDFIQESP